MLNILLIALFAICVAFTYNEGMWGAGVLFCNVLLAAVLATNLYEPVANLIDSMMPGLTYFADFVAAWLTFAVCLVLMRLSTDLISRHKVKCKKPVDLAGGIVFAVLLGWVMVQYTAFTMHMAPLSRNYMGFREKPDSSTFYLAPDWSWLEFMHNQSKSGQGMGGALARTPPANNPNEYVFDPQGDFILKYGQRRMNYSKESGLSVGK
jgi:uncharacterized membrane protein required for colicin V production